MNSENKPVSFLTSVQLCEDFPYLSSCGGDDASSFCSECMHTNSQ